MDRHSGNLFRKALPLYAGPLLCIQQSTLVDCDAPPYIAFSARGTGHEYHFDISLVAQHTELPV